MKTVFSESAQNSLRFHYPEKSQSSPTSYTDMADDARETPPRLAFSGSRLSWKRGIERRRATLPTHGLSILRSILHTAASSGYRRCRYIEWPRSPTLPTLVRRHDPPGQLPRPHFQTLLVQALSALHFGISLHGARRKNIERVFPLTRPCDEYSGRADDGADRRGATSASIEYRTVGSDCVPSCLYPHTCWTSALQ